MSVGISFFAIFVVIVFAMIFVGVLTQFAAFGGFAVMIARGLERERKAQAPVVCSFCGGQLHSAGPCPGCGAPTPPPAQP